MSIEETKLHLWVLGIGGVIVSLIFIGLVFCKGGGGQAQGGQAQYELKRELQCTKAGGVMIDDFYDPLPPCIFPPK